MSTSGSVRRSMTTLSATGALGHEPIHPGSFYEGIKRRLDFIGADAGSGDSGPYFLGADAPMNPEEWERHDLELPSPRCRSSTAFPAVSPSTWARRWSAPAS